MKCDSKTFGNRIRTLRAEHAFTQEDLAAKAGLGIATIQRAESAGRVSADTIASIAAAFDVTADTLTSSAELAFDRPYLPLKGIETGRQLLNLVVTSAQIEFGIPEITDLALADLLEQLEHHCQPPGIERLPVGVVAKVKLELELTALLKDLAAVGMKVSGATYRVRCHEVDDDCGAGISVLCAIWEETRGALQIGAGNELVERAYVLDALGTYEMPIDGVIYPTVTETTVEHSSAV